MVLVTIAYRGQRRPSLAAAAKLLGVAPGDLDARFGVVVIDPDRRLASVRVKAAALPADLAERGAVAGPFADPKIGPLGPPRR
jgi:hypothetical protein